MADNFQHGVSGNLLGGMDTSTGKITRVAGIVDGKVSVVEHHPNTGERFEAFTLPDWSKLIEVCQRVASHLMGKNLHHWEIALTDHEPVIVENNEIADLELHQPTNRKGFWSETVEKLFGNLIHVTGIHLFQ